jgi:hypothetical protein
MLKAIREWLWRRRERKLYRQMSKRINRDRRRMAPIQLPFTSGGKGDDGGAL